MKSEIVKLDNFGNGITYLNGKICFVYGGLPGDVVVVDVTNCHSKYCSGVIKEFIQKSSLRKENGCVYSHECGGCNFQNLSYTFENEYKEEKVRSLLCSKLNVDQSVIKTIVYGKDEFYRNKVILHGNGKDIGLYKYKSNEIMQIDYCAICISLINNIICAVKKISLDGDMMIRTSNDMEKSIISIDGNIDNYFSLISLCDVLIINGKVISGVSSIKTSIGKKIYYLSADSFFQVNLELTRLLYDKILECVKFLKPSKVLDLYCGTGSIGIYIADYIDELIGIDCNDSNIIDANKNAQINDVSSAEFICDKVENQIHIIDDVDLVIVDPPRGGLDSKSRRYLSRSRVKNIIYVSCDVVTLARDLMELSEHYNVIEVTPFNMFPRTYHCESITVLERR